MLSLMYYFFIYLFLLILWHYIDYILCVINLIDIAHIQSILLYCFFY